MGSRSTNPSFFLNERERELLGTTAAPLFLLCIQNDEITTHVVYVVLEHYIVAERERERESSRLKDNDVVGCISIRSNIFCSFQDTFKNEKETMKQQRFSLVIVIAFAACLSVSLLSPVEAIRTKIESRRPSRDKPNRERNLRTDYPSSDVTSVNAASNPSEGDPPTVLLETKTKFAGGGVAGAIGGAVGNAFVSNTASQKENCVGCKFVWKKIHAGLDQSAGYDTVKNAFERVCMNMPDVFYDVCDMMYDQEDDMVQDYLNNVDFEKMCTYVGVCWMGLCLPWC